MNSDRRDFLNTVSCSAAAILLNTRFASENLLAAESFKKKESEEPEVTATEDLMREHGVLRRILIIYSISADRLTAEPSKVPAEALNKAAKLFQAFGENYHEKKLEEAFIFPQLKRSKDPASSYVDTLIAQHNRGRQITDYIIAITKAPNPQSSDVQELAAVLKSMSRMYNTHTAIEDTVIFPAWKKQIGEDELDKMSDKFEDLEKQMFGEDGFEKAVKQISDIEAQLGLNDLAKFTAPPPPKI